MKARHIISRLVVIICGVFILFGCDPLSRHKVATTLFDGVPALPPPEQFCGDYYEKRAAEEAQRAMGKNENKAEQKGSAHAPYVEKRCDDCHDKTKPEGLVRPKLELCLGCHKNFIKGTYVHGPVALAECLACHAPHDSSFPSLLIVSANDTCATCHKEKRVAAGLHTKAMAQHFNCIDCHDPHFGNVNYFLK